MQPLFLKPVFKERIWGGKALQQEFGHELPFEKTGECWAISAHPNGPSIIENGPYAGRTLDLLWEKHPELFGNPKGKEFPLLTKILDANMDLSVQVHPNDEFAKVNENEEFGKTECWYIIDCKKDSNMIYGHNAKTKKELSQYINEGDWDKLLRSVKIKQGDFFFVPSGTIHALCEGTLVLEIQQSSDTTYRIYDYDRKDSDGNLRELHLDKAIEVVNIPHLDPENVTTIETRENVTITTFIKSEFFSVYKWDINGNAIFSNDSKYLLISVINGKGSLGYNGEQFSLSKGTHLIIPVGIRGFNVNGSCELIVTH